MRPWEFDEIPKRGFLWRNGQLVDVNGKAITDRPPETDPLPPDHSQRDNVAAPPAPHVPAGESRMVDFAREVLAFDPTPRQAAILSEIERGRIRTAVLRLGRRSGKGRIASVIATFEATANAHAHLAAVQPEEQVAIVVISRSQAQARLVHRFVDGYLKSPDLAPMVVKSTDDEIVLNNGVAILTLPCHAGSVRGYAVAVVIFDEMAWYQGRDGSPLDPKELWDAAVPATAQFPHGRVLVLSTPRWAGGFFPDLCERARSGRFPDMREWHFATAEMNPFVPTSFLAQEEAADPVAFRREYLAMFESGFGAVFDPLTVRAAVVSGLSELPPIAGLRYVISVDAAFVGDRFAVALGHAGPAGVELDAIRGWRGSKGMPVQVDPTLDEIAALSRLYNTAPVLIDQYAAEPIRQALRKRGVTVRERPWTNESKVDAVAATRRNLQGGMLALLDQADLIRELISLEQHPLPSGRPRIAAPSGGSDDYATALLALVAELAGKQSRGTVRFGAVA
jgi:hypothetical protein